MDKLDMIRNLCDQALEGIAAIGGGYFVWVYASGKEPASDDAILMGATVLVTIDGTQKLLEDIRKLFEEVYEEDKNNGVTASV